MSPHASRTALQVLLRFLGMVAFVAGLGTVLFGVASIVGAETVSGTVESETRFYAVWYAAAGLLLFKSASNPEADALIIRGTAAAFFVAGCARASSWVLVGEPHAVTKFLMVAELVPLS